MECEQESLRYLNFRAPGLKLSQFHQGLGRLQLLLESWLTFSLMGMKILKITWSSLWNLSRDTSAGGHKEVKVSLC